jgi:hypothetical protein
VDKELKSPDSGWNRRATLKLLRSEAQALLGQEEPSKAVQNEGNQSALVASRTDK